MLLCWKEKIISYFSKKLTRLRDSFYEVNLAALAVVWISAAICTLRAYATSHNHINMPQHTTQNLFTSMITVISNKFYQIFFSKAINIMKRTLLPTLRGLFLKITTKLCEINQLQNAKNPKLNNSIPSHPILFLFSFFFISKCVK